MEINIGRKVRLILEATETVYEPLLLSRSETGTSIVVVWGPRPSNCSIGFSRDKGTIDLRRPWTRVFFQPTSRTVDFSLRLKILIT